MLANTSARYGLVAQALHWGIFLLFVALFAVALSMTDMPKGPEKFQLYALHKSLGVTVLALALLRLVWRFTQVQPTAIAANAAQEKAAKAVHVVLYLLMFALPVTGYVMSMAGGHGISVFGLFDLPVLIGKNEELGETAEDFHGALAWFALAVIVVHWAAAVFHHRVLKDDTLRRMLPLSLRS